jgi:transcriptional regulator with XRE-family HTH domain
VASGWDLWVAQQVGSLLAATAPAPVLPVAGVSALDGFIHARCGSGPGAYGQFARLVDLHVNNLRRWRKGHALPTIDVLLRACHYLGVSLVDLLTGETAGLPTTTRPIPPARPRRRQPLAPTVPDTAQFRQNVEALLAEAVVPPLSAAATARRLGCTSATLARLCPEAYRTTTDRYRTHRTQQHEARLAELAADMRQIMTQLDAAGIYPAAKRVRPVLRQLIHPRNSHFNRLRHQLLRELGWTLGGTRLPGL